MLALIAGLLAVTMPAAPSPAMPAPAPAQGPTPCQISDLAISFDGKDGDFNGMSHSGTEMVVRSRSPRTCLLAGLPTVSFLDASGKVLPIERKAPPGMHPGPVVIPVALKPGGQAVTELRWISGDVFEKGRCMKAVAVMVTIAGKGQKVPLVANVCGEMGKVAGVEQGVLQGR